MCSCDSSYWKIKVFPKLWYYTHQECLLCYFKRLKTAIQTTLQVKILTLGARGFYLNFQKLNKRNLFLFEKQLKASHCFGFLVEMNKSLIAIVGNVKWTWLFVVPYLTTYFSSVPFLSNVHLLLSNWSQGATVRPAGETTTTLGFFIYLFFSLSVFNLHWYAMLIILRNMVLFPVTMTDSNSK